MSRHRSYFVSVHEFFIDTCKYSCHSIWIWRTSWWSSLTFHLSLSSSQLPRVHRVWAGEYRLSAGEDWPSRCWWCSGNSLSYHIWLSLPLCLLSIHMHTYIETKNLWQKLIYFSGVRFFTAVPDVSINMLCTYMVTVVTPSCCKTWGEFSAATVCVLHTGVRLQNEKKIFLVPVKCTLAEPPLLWLRFTFTSCHFTNTDGFPRFVTIFPNGGCISQYPLLQQWLCSWESVWQWKEDMRECLWLVLPWPAVCLPYPPLCDLHNRSHNSLCQSLLGTHSFCNSLCSLVVLS